MGDTHDNWPRRRLNGDVINEYLNMSQNETGLELKTEKTPPPPYTTILTPLLIRVQMFNDDISFFYVIGSDLFQINITFVLSLPQSTKEYVYSVLVQT